MMVPSIKTYHCLFLTVVAIMLSDATVKGNRIPKDTEHVDDVGPDTCGQDRQVLSKWFREHGDPTLIQDTVPVLVEATSPNPYDNPLNPPENSPAEAFCAMKWFSNMDSLGRRFYKLANVASEEDAIRYGFAVTHLGHCGACSSLQDLGVYIGRNLTTPTRICGALGILSDSLIDKCLKRIGFSNLCIPIWRYNVINTREKCFWPCLLSWIANEPFNKPDGSLNDCLQCDEDVSGPNFKYFAGRTRRGSGIPSSIYRPPEAIYHMSHCYWYGAL